MVPSGWKNSKLADVCTIINGRPFKPHEWRETGIPIIRIQNLNGSDVYNYFDGQYSDKVLIKSGQLLFAWSGSKGTSFGPHIWNGPHGLLNYHTWRMNVKDAVDSGYFYQYLKIITTRIESKAHGASALVHTQKGEMEKFPVVLPPLPEQRKIATILGTWDKAISTTERLIDNSKQQKKSLMQQLLTGKKRLLDDSGKPFEGEWEVVTLEKTAKYRRGSFPQPYGNPEWEDKVNGYPFVQVYDIDKNMKLKPSTKFKISDAAIGKSVFIPKETIIVSLQGSIGRVAITQYDAYVDRTVLLFQEFLSPMNKVFFAYVIQELFEIEKTKAPGGTIKTITKDVLSNFKILIPSLKEQQKIAAVLTNADKEIQLVEQQLADLKQEKKALMQQLLTGKRRVKVDNTEAA